MKVKVFEYTVAIRLENIAGLLEMLRYSGATVVKVTKDEPITFIVRHLVQYDDEEHLKRRIKFLKYQVIGRWGSFGYDISDLKEVELVGI